MSLPLDLKYKHNGSGWVSLVALSGTLLFGALARTGDEIVWGRHIRKGFQVSNAPLDQRGVRQER